MQGAKMLELKLAADARMILITISGFGDHIVMTPALRALRETYPYAQIDCIVRSDTAREFISAYGFFNQIFVLGEILHEMYVFDPVQTIKFGQNLAHVHFWLRLSLLVLISSNF